MRLTGADAICLPRSALEEDVGQGRRDSRKTLVGMSDTSHEIDFWDSVLETRGGQWSADFQHRMDPESQVCWFMRGKLFANAEVLDVGAGPLTTVGKRCGEDRIIVTAVDPLAEGYRSLLKKHGIVPPVRTILGFGEGLYEQFGANRFDLVNAQNSIDHSLHPMTVILEMISVARPGGWVTLLHNRNEGERRKYHGMHGWNFDMWGDALVLWNKDRFYNVTKQVQHVADCTVQELEGDTIFAEIRKRKGGEVK